MLIMKDRMDIKYAYDEKQDGLVIHKKYMISIRGAMV